MQLPYDERAERQVVGHAVASVRGAALAGTVARPEDFFGGDLGPLPLARCYRVALEIVDVTNSEERITTVAERADVAVEVVRGCVEGRVLMWDTNGRYPAKVVADARAREVMRACAQAFELIGTNGAEALPAALERVRAAVA